MLVMRRNGDKMTTKISEQTRINDITGAALEIDNQTEKYLTFFVDKQLYTIPSSQVIEIISMLPITYMPRLPEFVKGVINIRGKVIPVIELQMRLKKTPAVYDDQTCIIVIEIGELIAGFIVDQVHDVTDIAKNQISPAPKVSKKDKERDFLCGIAKLNDSIAMILDSEKTMEDSAKDAITKVKR